MAITDGTVHQPACSQEVKVNATFRRLASCDASNIALMSLLCVLASRSDASFDVKTYNVEGFESETAKEDREESGCLMGKALKTKSSATH